MRITKEVLNAQVDRLNRYTNRKEGERYFVGYENGHANLFMECGSGRSTISYGNTKKELSDQLSVVNDILSREAERRSKNEHVLCGDSRQAEE